MLSQKYRFHSRGGVRHVYQKGETLRSPLVALIFMPNTRGFQRFSVVVSKKIFKSAVSRNLIRRRVYEAIRLELPEYTTPMDCIFVVHSRNLATMPFRELQDHIHNLLRRTLPD